MIKDVYYVPRAALNCGGMEIYMENLVAKVSYLKGLCDGLKIDEDKPEGKLLSSIVDVLGDIAAAVDDVCDAHEELEEKVDEIDEDLADLEELAYDDDEEEDDDADALDDMDFFEIECPNCHEDVMIDFAALDEDKEIVCPNCHQEIELEFDCDCGDEDCDCHEHE